VTAEGGTAAERRGVRGAPGEGPELLVGLPRSYLRSCVLLLLGEGPSHGYDLLEQVRRLGVLGAEAGGMYRALRAMEQEGLVRSWWEPSRTGPPRRTYELTDEGRRALEDAVAGLRELRALVDALIARYALEPGGSGD
jgi:PadR family transcriptional regulator PadR